MSKDDDLLPKKSKAAPASSLSSKKGPPSRKEASLQMVRLMRVTRGIGLVLGGFVTLVGIMSLIGYVTDNTLIRLLGALVIVVALPALVADRILKRVRLGGGFAMLIDIFAIVLLGLALMMISADFMSRPLFMHEGDQYARSGSRFMSRVSYFLAGVSPVFPEEKAGAAGATSASASGSSKPAPGGSK